MKNLLINKTSRLPSWFRQNIPSSDKLKKIKSLIKNSSLNTVCESAHCPNLGACWENNTATFMILGEICTRACRFCAVKAGHPSPVDNAEPKRVALAIKQLNLNYAVITSVARDDLPDEGVEQFVNTINEIRNICPHTKIEVLIPDFSNRRDLIQKLANAKPDAISHNIETIKRLSPSIRPQADYDRSLAVLKNCQDLAPQSLIKSGFMLGFGETHDEVYQLMLDLHKAGCSLLTIGQYLAPSSSKRHVEITRFVSPDEFKKYRTQGLSLGFKHIMSAPLVRSSFMAEKGYQECL